MGSATAVVRLGDGTRVSLRVPIAGFEFGVTIGANDSRHPGGGTDDLQWSYNTVTAALKRDLGQRIKFFGTSGLGKAVTMWQASPGREPLPLLTSEVFDLEAWSSLFDTLTAPIAVCYHQEFTKALASGAIVAADFNAQYADLRQMIDGHPNGHLVELQFVGSEFPERTASSPIWAKLKPLPRCRIGNDTYVTQANDLDPATACAGSVAWYQAWAQEVEGTRLAISEGAVSRTKFSPDQRITYLQNLSEFLPTIDPLGSFNYWASDNSGGDPSHDWSVDKAGDEQVAATLASLVRG